MNIKIVLTLIFSSISILTGCEGGEVTNNNIHNEMTGLYASLNDQLYYVDNNTLFYQTNGNTKELNGNVVSIQKNADTLYCVYTENHKDYSLYCIDGDELEFVLDLKSGTYQQSMFYNNKLYVCINNEITIYDLQTKEQEKIPIDNFVTRFIVDDSNLYYWSVNFADNSMDSYVDSIASGERLPLFEGKMCSYDLNTNTSDELVNSLSDEDMFFISPTKHGVVFYDPEQAALNIYNKSVKTLYNCEISSMITDDNNIYFSTDDNIVYRLNVITNDLDIFIDDVNTIKGMDDQYVFNGDECILIKD